MGAVRQHHAVRPGRRVMWGTWLSLVRSMTDYDAATFLTDGKHMIENPAIITLRTFMSLGAVAAAVGAGLTIRIAAQEVSRRQLEVDHSPV